ncbi:MAG TPA: transposase [Thermoanaerobaculia bacterium]|nr:transposase [Thermoanaerobaculia bacterium]
MERLLFRNRYRVPSARLPGWDYSWPGVYAVTICVQGRDCCLSEVVEDDVALSPFGVIVAEEWLAIPRMNARVILDEWIVMPDHVHGILVLDNQERPDAGRPAESLGTVVGQFKQRATKRIRARRRPKFAWQERYYDQILRDDENLNRYRAYIRENPTRWRLQGSVEGQ